MGNMKESMVEREIARYRDLTPAQAGALEDVTAETVLGWIHRCGLRAKNIGTKSRPIYRIKREWLASFMATRTVNG
jgi:hypothetical protein